MTISYISVLHLEQVACMYSFDQIALRAHGHHVQVHKDIKQSIMSKRANVRGSTFNYEYDKV